MAGYQWVPYFRLTPGGTKNLRSLMSWAGGPVEIGLIDVPLIETRTTVAKRVKNVVWGVRKRVTFVFAIGGTMSDHSVLKDIVNALLTEATLVELSLNNQVTYREVELVRYSGPDPFEKKTVTGAKYGLEVQTVDPVAGITAIGSGSW